MKAIETSDDVDTAAEEPVHKKQKTNAKMKEGSTA